MKHFAKIAEGVDVVPMNLAITQQPELWDQHTFRKVLPGTPHAAMSDIWLRYRDYAERDEENPTKFVEPHFAVWYPAFYKLPVRDIIFDMMARVQATHLGGVLITRIPPGGRIEPHTDRGWHPTFYNTKLYLVLATNDRTTFRCEDERVIMKTGDIWWLDNTVEHEVVNDGDTERMTLIVCMRREP